MLLSQVIPQILGHVRSILLSNVNVDVTEVFEGKSGSWLKLMEAIKDAYAVERLSEQLLRQLAAEDVTDVEAYWILWILFHRIYESQTSFRLVNMLKCILYMRVRVTPIRASLFCSHFIAFVDTSKYYNLISSFHIKPKVH